MGYFALLTFATLLVTFSLDALFFRIGIYPKYLNPESSTGSFELGLRIEGKRNLVQPYRALLFGDSQMAEGFSTRIANSTVQGSGIEFVNAASPGTTMRSSYYLVRDLDPNATRYNIILVGLRDYQDVDAEDRNDRIEDLRWVIARLRLSDAVPFAWSLDSWRQRLEALRDSLFEGIVYRTDVQDFLQHSGQRLKAVREYERNAAGWRDNYGGNSHNLAGLHMDSRTGQLTFPVELSRDVIRDVSVRLHPRPSPGTGWETRYRDRWLLPIIQRYPSAKAIIIFRIPQRPLPVADPYEPAHATFVSSARLYGNVTVLNEHLFDDLQRPENFFDGVHLNAQGRAEFSAKLAQQVVRVLGRGDAL